MGIPFVKGLRCPVSDPANPHTLPRSDGEHLLSGCFKCGKQHVYQDDLGLIQDHYRCTTCDVWFHTFCQDRPRKIRHPYHLQHPRTLTLIDGDDESVIGDDETVIAISEQENKSESVFNRGCNWCGGDLDKMFYRCSICGFCLDHSCVKKSPPPTITNPRSHHHPLVLFPRPFSLPWDACGLVDVSDPVYACYQCNYMVHQSCISLPRVIKITRHPHRLSHTPFFQPQVSTSCQICYKAVDIKYGQYACHLEGCSYVAHSTCATHENVWDGNELEWEPEEETCETEEDIEPFEKVGVGLIRYFLHQEHHLRLLKYDRVRDADDKQCEACILPMDARDFYSCMQCDFFLHEVCASLPRKIHHALHQHPLVLEPSLHLKDNIKNCSSCSRKICGFRYTCSKHDCQMESLVLDIRCILVPNCFTHKIHPLPLFIATCFKDCSRFDCKGCNSHSYGLRRLQCTLCDFVLCYRCATTPNEVYYKHDKHLLFICYEKREDDTYWCEICETKICFPEWFYECTECCITLHSRCISRSSLHMKYGYTFHYGDENLEVVRNSSNTRPICGRCDNRCTDSVYYKHQEKKKSCCSRECSRYL